MEQQYESFPQEGRYEIGRKELICGGLLVVLGLLITNSILFGGFNLGFALFGMGIVVTVGVYLRTVGKKLTGYSGALLGLSLVILAGFARSADGFVKFVMICFLFVSVGLGLCLTAAQNRRATGGFRSLADSFRCFFVLPLEGIGPGFSGLAHTLKHGGNGSKTTLSVLLGLVIAIPLLLILVPLLMSADAAFEGLMDLLPSLDIQELFATLVVGAVLSCILFGWAMALAHAPKKAPAAKGQGKGLGALTINTVLIAVNLTYLLYLLSQLAYFSGGFSGLLPEGYSTAEYARRGFFEMAWLCAVNLSVLVFAMATLEKKEKMPGFTRFLCLFLGLVTLFLVITASAKMAFYIRSYGLTRLRVLTEVIMVFLGLTTAVVTTRLFAPKLPYMKVVLLTALTMGALVIWADVDTVVAHYNVRAYQAGATESVDVHYLSDLGSGAVPYLAELAEDKDPEIAGIARDLLTGRSVDTDLRSWNWADYMAEGYFKEGA